jgi:hypothetical protein
MPGAKALIPTFEQFRHYWSRPLLQSERQKQVPATAGKHSLRLPHGRCTSAGPQACSAQDDTS